MKNRFAFLIIATLLLAASVNANVGAFALSPMATEMEKQTIQWLSNLIGYQTDCGGLFVSGGNMANFLGFLAARRNKIDGDIRQDGLPEISIDPSQNSTGYKEKRRYTVYCAKGTHTWIHKATDLFGHGTDSIRWIDCFPSFGRQEAWLKSQASCFSLN